MLRHGYLGLLCSNEGKGSGHFESVGRRGSGVYKAGGHQEMNRMVRAMDVTSRVIAVVLWCLLGSATAAEAADTKGERSFHAMVTDAQGLETEVKNMIFYWEEKISETSFVPHELRYFPVKRGTSTVNIKFDTVKQVEVKPSEDKGSPVIAITLQNGKTGEFVPAVSGSVRGESDFGQVDVPMNSVSKIVFK